MDKIIAEIPREGGEVLRVSMGAYKGRQLLNVRIWYTDAQGELRPTKKGITVGASQYENFKNAVLACGDEFTDG